MSTLPDEVTLSDGVDAVARQSGFAGAVSIVRGGETVVEKAYGLADRARGIRNTAGTRFGIASGVKGLTALAVVSLISDSALAFETTARSVLGGDLPLIDDAVTVEQLLAHRSGIGDYFDEEAEGEITDYVLPVPVHELVATEDYLRVLGGHPQKFAPGERFSYCNGGYVVLALIAERVSGVPFHELVRTRVCEPAGMTATGFPRSDELPGDAALGYLPIAGHDRTNVFHLPVVGSGDGGAYSTVGDVGRFWLALLGGRIVSRSAIARMLERVSDAGDGMGYGLGFWLRDADGAVLLEGYDAGVSFRSWHRVDRDETVTVISNSSDGAWPVARRLAELLG
ncbi:serine hydrolase domain-containing protein [Leifsonia poae]|uniref:Serine hydrolase n=1 Tax=Leifsonia poae TaxID=110933 RepID=A0A9W6HDW0_9MICO|nr:serine hydrolase domain-containing protein [Leifsonia poae]GLJ78273.1 serine hydrolase [Leifsonia poae]